MAGKYRHFYFLALSFVLVALAPLLRLLAPLVAQLPANYRNESLYHLDGRFRDRPDALASRLSFTLRRVDQVLAIRDGVAIIKGSLYPLKHRHGQIIFQTERLYGVDRQDHSHIPFYGDEHRTGHYFLPPHTEPTTYFLWDPMYLGRRILRFEGPDRVEGLEVYRFAFSISGLEETAGYSALPTIPEQYEVLTDGSGHLWVEPVSGTIVDFEDQGVSYFTDPASGIHMKELLVWQTRYTDGTRSLRVHEAAAMRARILFLERWLPGFLLLVALLAALPASRVVRDWLGGWRGQSHAPSMNPARHDR